MSLVYLLGGLIVIMLIVLMTLIKSLRRFGYIALLAPILASGYFLAQILMFYMENL